MHCISQDEARCTGRRKGRHVSGYAGAWSTPGEQRPGARGGGAHTLLEAWPLDVLHWKCLKGPIARTRAPMTSPDDHLPAPPDLPSYTVEDATDAKDGGAEGS